MQTPEDNRAHHAPIKMAGAMAFVGASALLILITWNAWVVNYDGGAYLVLAERLRTGLGYTFPDGSPAVFRGPSYPLAFSATWLIAPISETTAIWASKSFILIGSVATVGVVWLSVRRIFAAVVAGLVVASHPLLFASGAFYFVPDGMAAVFVLIGTAIATPRVGTTYNRWRPWMAGIVLGFGTLTKETAAFGLLVIAAILLSMWRTRTGIAVLSKTMVGWGLPVGLWTIWVLSISGHLPAPATAVSGYAAWTSLAAGAALLIAFWWFAGRDHDIATAPLTDVSTSRAIVSVVAIFLAPLAILLMIGSPAVQPIAGSWEAVVSEQLGVAWGAGLSQWLTWSAITIIVVAMTVAVRQRNQLLTPMALVSLGLSLAVWGAISGFGVRNGAILVYGLAWLLGVVIAVWSDRISFRVIWRSTIVALVVATLWINVFGLSTTNRWVAQRALNWNTPGVHRAAEWLAENAQGKTAAGTPIFLNYLSFRGSGAFNALLVPVFETGRGDALATPSAFDRRVWWAAHISESPVGTVEIGRTYSRKFISSIVERDLLDALKDDAADLIVVTGTTVSTGPYEGVMLVPYLEAAPWAHRVYTSTDSELPYWVLVYQISDEAQTTPGQTTTVYSPLPWRPAHILDSDSALGVVEYAEMIQSIIDSDR